MQKTVLINSMIAEIQKGLTTIPKYIPSKFFYDAEGSRIFQLIMRMPEYYLTDCEYEIFETRKESILDDIYYDKGAFDLVELGAGDGLKTSLLLSHFSKKKVDFKYVPVDISEDALQNLVNKTKNKYPEVRISALAGDYFKILSDLYYCEGCKKVALFLGSNIGNYHENESIDFFHQLSSVFNKGDIIITGFDLVKDPWKIMLAYNDPHGYTRDFNMNLLRRLNNELGANFDLSKFQHHPVYDPEEYKAKSYLLSTEPQDVYFKNLDFNVHFDKWESIFTEQSRKFTLPMIEAMAEETGFRIVKNYFDKRGYFVDSLWEKK